MIPISRFREWLVELMTEVNAESARLAGVAMAVKEEHMVKKLKDKAGVWLAVNYPDALGTGEEDNATDDQAVFFFVVEKKNPGSMTDDEEVQHYEQLQEVMLAIRKAVRESAASGCVGISAKEEYKIEWEYQIFGGFNGLSMGFSITDLKND